MFATTIHILQTILRVLFRGVNLANPQFLTPFARPFYSLFNHFPTTYEPIQNVLSIESTNLIIITTVLFLVLNLYCYFLDMRLAYYTSTPPKWTNLVSTYTKTYFILWISLLIIPLTCYTQFTPLLTTSFSTLSVLLLIYLLTAIDAFAHFAIAVYYKPRTVTPPSTSVCWSVVTNETLILRQMTITSAVLSLLLYLLADYTITMKDVIANSLQVYTFPLAFIWVSTAVLALTHGHFQTMAFKAQNYQLWIAQNRSFLNITPFLLIFWVYCLVRPVSCEFLEVKVVSIGTNYLIYGIWLVFNAIWTYPPKVKPNSTSSSTSFDPQVATNTPIYECSAASDSRLSSDSIEPNLGLNALTNTHQQTHNNFKGLANQEPSEIRPLVSYTEDNHLTDPLSYDPSELVSMNYNQITPLQTSSFRRSTPQPPVFEYSPNTHYDHLNVLPGSSQSSNLSTSFSNDSNPIPPQFPLSQPPPNYNFYESNHPLNDPSFKRSFEVPQSESTKLNSNNQFNEFSPLFMNSQPSEPVNISSSGRSINITINVSSPQDINIKINI